MADMVWNLIGHEWAAHLLQQQVAKGVQRHAYLITGPRGVGRRTLALCMAQAVNCSQPPAPGQLCGECRACQLIQQMQHPDLSVVQAEIEGGVLKIEGVRTLQHELSLTPYEAAFRIGLLLRLQEANVNTQNALLKTLEEPNPRVMLLATADEAEQLLPTIVSRCEVLRLRPLGFAELTEALEKRGIPQEQAGLLAQVSSGRPGYALRLHAEPELLERRKWWLEHLLSLHTATRRERIAFADQVTKGKERDLRKEELHEGLQHWLGFWRDVLLAASGSNAALSNPDYSAQIAHIAAQVGEVDAAQKVTAHQQALQRLYTANLRMLVENVLLH